MKHMENQELALYNHFYGCIEPTTSENEIDEMVEVSGQVVVPDIR